MGTIIEVKELLKRYGKITAVDSVSFAVEEGALFSFLGPNGAGKSTTISILCTLLGADSGEVEIAGYKVGRDDTAVRSCIGVVFQESILDPLLTVKENLAFRASFYGIKGQTREKRLSRIAEIICIGEILKRPYGKLSGGQRRRVDIARALLNIPRVLFLDEPTTGLDPQTRKKVWATIKDLQKEEKLTVFLTTHYMEEAAGTDDVAVIDGGKIVARGTPESLRMQYSSDKLLFIPCEAVEFQRRLGNENIAFTQKTNAFEIAVRDSHHALSILKANEDILVGFEVVRGSMDDAFMNITGHGIRGEEV